ncbi:hypothetical protein KAJ27_22625, partial [bacterium]|nr:hypothetical protein [bacterium]
MKKIVKQNSSGIVGKFFSFFLIIFAATLIPASAFELNTEFEVSKFNTKVKNLETEIRMLEASGNKLRLKKVDSEIAKKVMAIFVDFLKKIKQDVYSTDEEKKKFMSEIMMKRLQFSEEYWLSPKIRNYRYDDPDKLLPDLIKKYNALDYQERLRTSRVFKRFSTEKLIYLDSRQKEIEFNVMERKFYSEIKKIISVSGEKYNKDNKLKESRKMMNEYVAGLNDLKLNFDIYSHVLMNKDAENMARISEKDVEDLIKYRSVVLKKLSGFSFIDLKEELKNLSVREEWFRFLQKNISDAMNCLKSKVRTKLKKVADNKSVLQKKIIDLESRNLELKKKSGKVKSLWTEISENIRKIDRLKKSLGLEKIELYRIKLNLLLEKGNANLKNISRIFPIFRDLRTEILTQINKRIKTLKTFVKDLKSILQSRRALKLKFQKQLLELQTRSSEFYTDYIHPKRDVDVRTIEERYLDTIEIVEFLKKFRKLYEELTAQIPQLVEQTAEGRYAMHDLFHGKICYDQIPFYIDSPGWISEDFITVKDDINKPDPNTLVKKKIHEDNLDLDEIMKKIKLWKEKILVFDIKKKKRKEKELYQKKVKGYKNKKISVNIDIVMTELRKWGDVKDIPYSKKYEIARIYDELKRKIDVLIRDGEISPEINSKFDNLKNVWTYFKKRIQWNNRPCEIIDISINNVRMTDRLKEVFLNFDDTRNGTIEIFLKIREEFYPVKTVYCKLIDLKNELIKGYRVEKKGRFSYWRIFFPVPFKNERFRFTFTAKDRYENVLTDTFRTYTANCTWFDERKSLERFFTKLFNSFNEEDIVNIQKLFNRYNFNTGNLDAIVDGLRHRFRNYRRLYVKIRDLKWEKVRNLYRIRIKWNKTFRD